MAFIERVMHWGVSNQDSEPPTFEPEARYLAVHSVYAVSILIVLGHFTVAQYKTAIGSTAADDVDIDALVASVPSAEAARAVRIHEIHAVFILAEDRSAGYSTPTLVRTKLGI